MTNRASDRHLTMPVRLKIDVYRQVEEMAEKTRMSMSEVVSILIDHAMADVELKPVPAYDISFKSK